MKSKSLKSDSLQCPRPAFTLVEMLVAVTLVLLMMTMFTTIFQMATSSVSKQRIIAESDQRARSLTTILRADFAKRSLRNCFPFLPQENPATSVLPFGNRTGYVYISCNNPASGQDDIIQFTVDARQVQTNPDQSLYYGASRLLWDKIAENAGANTNTALQFSPNQPEADDGDMFPNGTAGTNVAEISLFMRGGNLIRRVMLIREPLPVAGEDLEIQPKSALANDYFFTSAGVGEFYLAAAPAVPQSDFWRFFDYSAVPANMGNVPDAVAFIGIDALANDGAGTSPSLGRPFFRFGFNPMTGMSREHENASATTAFIGRYLQAETSAAFQNVPQISGPALDEDFNWPNAESSLGSWPGRPNGNPLDIANAVSINPISGLVNEFDGPLGRGGERRVEDVLLSNVREFRIELWDSRLERWVVPGHEMVRLYLDGVTPYLVAGDYHIARSSQLDKDSLTQTYGPLQISPSLYGIPHVFDTWHPQIARDFDGDMFNDIAEHQAPYYPLRYYPPRQTDSQLGPSAVSQPDPLTEYDPHPLAKRTGTNKGYWQEDAAYDVGDVVFARGSIAFAGWNADTTAGHADFEWNEDAAGIPRQSVHIAYRCVGTTNGGTSGTSSAALIPGWQSPGLRILDNDLIWEGFQNYQPLKSIRLTIQYIEPNSEQPKQLTLIMPMTDEER